MNVTTTSVYVTDHLEADLAINNNRLKKHNDIIYLEDGQEFQIELSNKSQSTYLAKIKLNGNYISESGIVLRPGEHVFLERYLDNNKKFKFSTYNVKDTEANKIAIENNGIVEIEYYKEYTHSYVYPTWPITYWPSTYATSSSNECNMISDVNLSYIETGRVEEGSESTQTFTYSNITFEAFTNKTIKYHIKPTSQEAINIKEIRNYCTSCGRRAKHNWKFCPGCGTCI